jgi:hypothetical protein
MELIYEASSLQGQKILVYEDGVVITNKSKKQARALPVDYRTFLYSEITSIDFKNCGWFAGLLEFHVKSTERRLKDLAAGLSSTTTFSFANDSLPRNRELASEMDKIQIYIQLRVGEYLATHKDLPGKAGSAADEILKFKSLLDQGAITQEEYDKKKKELLNI